MLCDFSTHIPVENADLNEVGKLITEEERETGAVSAGVYWAYAKACTVILAGLAMVMQVGWMATTTGTHFWLSTWAGEAQRMGNMTASQLVIAL